MNERKNCIFYLPYPLEKTGNRARQLRPRKMLYAFRELGYSVFLIQGYSAKRKRRIRKLKELIDSGVKFDFLYGETSTEPIELSDPNHLPMHPMMDFAFFRYLNKKEIPVGIFYPDVYWKFPVYKESVSGYRYYAAIAFYKRELKLFRETMTRLYLPDLKMLKYLDTPGIESVVDELPPGADPVTVKKEPKVKKDILNMFYVGGISDFYRMDALLLALQDLDRIHLTICCRENEWEKEKDHMEPLMTDRVTVVHKNEDELLPYYDEADLCSLLFEYEEYRGMARPVKAYEYLGHHLPVVATENTAIGDFARDAGFGWSIPYETSAIRNLLTDILEHPERLEEKRKKAEELAPENLWTSRAKKVAEDLTVTPEEN